MVTGWVTDGNDRHYLYEDGSFAVGRVVIDGKTHFFSSKGKWVLFCNPWNPVPIDFETKLVTIERYRFDSVGRDSLQTMMDACREAGLSVSINNTYRSKTTQQIMWNESVNKFMAQGMTKEEAEAETGKSTAIPGHSEHQTGLAVDLNGPNETYAWLAENCWEYGFILRYPDNKIEITGIIYEPWHFRYVGTELSLELKELGITMEEYFDQLTPKTEG
jgi:D-alanyl-D-alanine carboxypeptidase